MDRLTPVLSRFALNVSVLHVGTLEQAYVIQSDHCVGYVHWVKQGTVNVAVQGMAPVIIDQPSVLFIPRGVQHTLTPVAKPLQVILSMVDFGHAYQNPMMGIQDRAVIIALDQARDFALITELLFEEAFAQRCGKQFATDQLLQYFFLKLLRHLIQNNRVSEGIIKALSDPRLLKAVTSMHDQPAKDWTVQTLAEQAGMSRARFAALFKHETGYAPLDYLTEWRMSIVQSLLKEGQSVKSAARAVGYVSPAALSRVFTKRVGSSPSAWSHASTQGVIDRLTPH